MVWERMTGFGARSYAPAAAVLPAPLLARRVEDAFTRRPALSTPHPPQALACKRCGQRCRTPALIFYR